MSQKNEIRKPVEGYEDRYEISNFGRLYSKKTKLLKEVNHIDGNKLNNVYTNLEWISRTKNYRHAVSSGLIIRDEQGKFLRQL